MNDAELEMYGWKKIGSKCGPHGGWQCWDNPELSDGRPDYTKTDATHRTKDALKNFEIEKK